MNYKNSLFNILVVEILNKLELHTTCNNFILIVFSPATNSYRVNYHSEANLRCILTKQTLNEYYNEIIF